MLKYRNFRNFSLVMAESFDAWRIMPRLMLMAYGLLVMHLYLWYKSIPTYVQERCDAAVLQIFLNNETPLEDAKHIACTVQDVVGGPTPAQTTLVTTIIGLSSIIFGFYTASGRRWDNGMPDDIKDHKTPILPIPNLPPVKLTQVNENITPNIQNVQNGPNGPIS